MTPEKRPVEASARSAAIQDAAPSPEQRSRHPLRRVQRLYGNRFAARLVAGAAEGASELPSELEAEIEGARGRGAPLPGDVQAKLEGALGADLAAVRIHTGPGAEGVSRALNARAFTTGKDVFFGRGAYDPTSSGGQELLAHEVVHVVQQDGAPVRAQLELGPADDEYEREADTIARGVVRRWHDARVPRQSRAHGRVQRLEAPMHESAELYGLSMGAGRRNDFTLEEAGSVYFGNWMRDLNQVFVPLVRDLLGTTDAVHAMINYMAVKKFGRPVTAEQFGYYIPAEHIDSPAGLVAGLDTFEKPPPAPPAPVARGAGTPVATTTRPAGLDTPQESLEPTAKAVAGSAATLFDVDQHGVMAYIRRTNLHIERRLELAARTGRNEEGMMHFGAALHAVEDLFAHSNWIEIAVSKLLAQQPRLLPRVQGQARRLFTFTGNAATPGGNRPVLATGSFTSIDTQISIGSEIGAFLRAPPEAPRTHAEAAAEQEFVFQMLRATAGVLDNPQVRGQIRDLIGERVPVVRTNKWAGAAVDKLLDAPIHTVYRAVAINPPDWLREVIAPAQTLFRGLVSTFAMQPLAAQLDAAAIEARVSDTSLINNAAEAQQASGGAAAPGVLDKLRAARRLGGGATPPTQAQIEAAAAAQLREEGKRRTEALAATPEGVIAGPTHSQLAKDHPSSPLFGLAFLLATVAVRRLGDRMLAAWDEAARGTTTAFPFPARPDEKTDPDGAARYDRLAGERTEGLERGAAVVARGRGIADERAYDLAASRAEAAARIRAIADALDAVSRAPGQTATQLERLDALLGGLEDPGSREQLSRARERLRQAAGTARSAGQAMNRTVALQANATALRAAAKDVEGATTHDKREAANEALLRERDRIIETFAQDPTPDAGFQSAVLVALNREIATTAVTYTREQRRRLEAAPPLRVVAVDLPDISSKPTALRALLAESRLLIDHPHESKWWESTVTTYVRQNEARMQAEIEARNVGVPMFRPPGAKGGGHAD